MKTKLANVLFYALLFMAIAGICMLIDFLISKTPIGKSKLYKNLKNSLKNIFLGAKKEE